MSLENVIVRACVKKCAVASGVPWLGHVVSNSVNLTFGARALLKEFSDGLEKVGPPKWKENLCYVKMITHVWLSVFACKLWRGISLSAYGWAITRKRRIYFVVPGCNWYNVCERGPIYQGSLERSTSSVYFGPSPSQWPHFHVTSWFRLLLDPYLPRPCLLLYIAHPYFIS